MERKSSKLCPDQLKAYIKEKPDSYQSEIAEVFNCTQSAVSYALKRLNLTRKKTLSYLERNEALYLYRENGYSPKVEPIIGRVSGRKYKRTNLIFSVALAVSSLDTAS